MDASNLPQGGSMQGEADRVALRCPPDVLRRLPDHFVDDLADALRAGDEAAVIRLLDRGEGEGFPLEAHIAWEGTALMVAARSGHRDLVRMLLERGAEVNMRRTGGYTALHNAAREGRYATACLLLEHGAAFNTIGHGQSPMADAAEAGCLLLVQELVRRGADPYATGKDGRMPLFLALYKGFWLIAKWLLEAGVDRAQRDYSGVPPLIAAIWGKATREQVTWLLEQGEDVYAVALYYNGTALHTAAATGNADVARLLLERGANREARDVQGRTPLHDAARNGHADALRLLLAWGAKIEARDGKQHTALYAAAEAGQSEAALALLDGGADIEAADKRGFTPLLCAADYPMYPYKQPALTTAARMLLTHGANANAVSRRRDTPLHNALRTRELDLVRFLLQHGADPARAEAEGKFGLLSLAAVTQDVELARLLLDAGANVEGRDGLDRTALMIATYGNDKPLMTLLLARGADPNAVNKAGKRVLDFAVKGGRARVTLVKMLTDAGAEP